MPRRTRRQKLIDPEIRRYLEQYRRARDTCILIKTAVPVNSEESRAVGRVIAAIDALAEVLSGDPLYFHPKLEAARDMPKR